MFPAPILVGGLAIIALLRPGSKSLHGVLTPERNHLLQSALNSRTLTAEQLEKLADGFDQAGLKPEASLLRKRAKLRSLPPEHKEKRKDVFRKALACKDPDKVDKIAAVFEAQGATGSAKTLRMYSLGLRNAETAIPVQKPEVVKEEPKDVVAETPKEEHAEGSPQGSS